MNTAPASPQASEATLPAAGIARLLDAILAGLIALISTRIRFLGDRAAPLDRRLSRIRERLARVLAHLAAGRIPRPHRARPHHDHTPRARTTPLSAPTAPAPTLPTRPGWVAHALDYNARNLASQLDHLLNRPGVAECLAAAPGIARTMRPLCRSLGIALPPALRLPPRPLGSRPPRSRAPRSRSARPPRPEPAPPTDHHGTPDRPLPRYVLAAVRAWKRPREKTG